MIPVCEPLLGEQEFKNVEECMKTGWISSAGKYIDEFETKWAEYCGRKYGVAVCNGTTALSAAVACLELVPGDEVLLPSFTIISCALAVIEVGAIPVLVDCTPDTWTMDVQQVEEKITARTKAVMPVHIYGHPVDMEAVMAISERHSLRVIEDAAEAHGARYRNKICGSFGELSCFSFYANKIITTGEGGMVLTDEPELAEKLRLERNLGFQPQRRFFHNRMGHNYRMTNVQAAIGVAQLTKIEQHIQKKKWMAHQYTERLRGVEGLQLPVQKEWASNVFWMYGVVLDDSIKMNANDLAFQLRALGIETRPFFLGMHEQPVFHNRGLFIGEKYPVTERIARRGLYLPSGLGITMNEIDQVCDAMKKVLL